MSSTARVAQVAHYVAKTVFIYIYDYFHICMFEDLSLFLLTQIFTIQNHERVDIKIFVA